MRKIIYLLLLLPVILCFSCDGNQNNVKDKDYKPINGEGTATITFDPNGGMDLAPKVYYIGEVPGDDIPETTYQGYDFLGWTTEKDTKLFYDFSKAIYQDVTVYALWESKIKDYSHYLDEYIPNVIDHNLDLPTEDGELILMWGSSDLNLFNTSGVINRPRNDTNITITLDVYVEHQIVSYEKEVTIKAIELKTLQAGNLVFGYYSSWNFHGVTKEILETVDVINLSFGYVDKDFTLTYADLTQVIPKLIECHSYGVRVVLSVQGYSSGGYNFSQAAKNQTNRTTLANSMLEFIEKYNFDGIDIDWEYPGYNTGTETSVDKLNYTLLCSQIKKTLKERNSDYIISAAIPGGPYTTSRFDLASLGKVLDYIHIMTYDLETSSYASHHTALYKSQYTPNQCTVSESVNIYLNKGVPANKLCIGLAFYGKYFTASAMGATSSAKKNITYSKIRTDYLSRLGKGVTYYWDSQACAPYLIDTTNNHVVTYDDEQSIKAKCEYALASSLAGVMIWELGEDDKDELITYVNKYIK